MTIAIGLKMKNGVILATDMLHVGAEVITRRKIQTGFFGYDRRRYSAVSGGIFSKAGHATEFDPTAIYASTLQEHIDAPVWLDDPDTIFNDAFQLSDKLEPISHVLSEDRYQEWQVRIQTAAFIAEHDDLRCSLVIRLFSSAGPDLMQVARQSVSSIRSFACHGSGAPVVMPILNEGYQPEATLESAVDLIIHAMNEVLKSFLFKGYEIIVVERLGDTNLIRSALDFDARSIASDVRSHLLQAKT